MDEYWEDRLTANQLNAVDASIRAFKRTRKTNTDRSVLYDKLVDAGMTSEEASEMSSLDL